MLGICERSCGRQARGRGQLWHMRIKTDVLFGPFFEDWVKGRAAQVAEWSSQVALAHCVAVRRSRAVRTQSALAVWQSERRTASNRSDVQTSRGACIGAHLHGMAASGGGACYEGARVRVGGAGTWSEAGRGAGERGGNHVGVVVEYGAQAELMPY